MINVDEKKTNTFSFYLKCIHKYEIGKKEIKFCFQVFALGLLASKNPLEIMYRRGKAQVLIKINIDDIIS